MQFYCLNKSLIMNQNRYNRKMRLYFYRFSSSSPAQKEMLTSTQLNLSKFQRSKHEIFAGIGKKEQSSKKLKAINHSNREQENPQKIHLLNHHSSEWQSIYSNANSKNMERDKLQKGNIREVMLIDSANFKKEDSFPFINAKKFSIKKIDRRFKKNQMNAPQQTAGRPKYHSLFEPWQISDEFGDPSKF